MITEDWSLYESVTARKNSSVLCQSPCTQERLEQVYGKNYWFGDTNDL